MQYEYVYRSDTIRDVWRAIEESFADYRAQRMAEEDAEEDEDDDEDDDGGSHDGGGDDDGEILFVAPPGED